MSRSDNVSLWQSTRSCVHRYNTFLCIETPKEFDQSPKLQTSAGYKYAILNKKNLEKNQVSTSVRPNCKSLEYQRSTTSGFKVVTCGEWSVLYLFTFRLHDDTHPCPQICSLLV